MIREGQLKLIVCESDPDQMFDLANDPQELSQPGRRARVRRGLGPAAP